MASLKEVRNRIQSVNSTQQITKAMKMVAAAKLRRAQDAIIQLRPYAGKLNDLLKNLSADSDDSVQNPYAVEREVKNVLLIVITSDRGLCGAFNSSIFKGVKAHIQAKYAKQFEQGNVTLLTIGRKGYEHFSKREFKVDGQFTSVYASSSFETIRTAAEYAMDAFVKGTYDAIDLVYNEFKNVATQDLKIDSWLPMLPPVSTEEKNAEVNYIFEPSKETILTDLVPKSLKILFYKGVLESNASEQGARMTAMDKATENAGELLKELRLTYNRSRQASITNEILEIVGGAEALG